MSALVETRSGAGRPRTTAATAVPSALFAAVLLASVAEPLAGQFRDEFAGPPGQIPAGWAFFAGDGAATMDFRQSGGFARVSVDATGDVRGIWWALVKRDVASALDLARLARPGHALRLEARIRLSHAPKRVNLHFNTQRTTNFHTQLMEYDIPDTAWHTISMTVRDPDVRPGDNLNVQMALMDWGLGRYHVDVDYFRADVLAARSAPPDLGEPLPYRPPVPPLASFGDTALVAQDAMVDLQFPEVNYAGWVATDAAGRAPVLTVGGTQLVILRWDLRRYAGRKAAGAGVLELTTRSLQRTRLEREEFGQVRIAEIVAGEPAWEHAAVTLQRLTGGRPLDEVFNPQMIVDTDMAERAGGTTVVTISRPVLQRLLDGRTLGLVIRPLGSISAALYGLEHEGGRLAPRLYFNLAGAAPGSRSAAPAGGRER